MPTKKRKVKFKTPGQALKEFCRQCVGGFSHDVPNCEGELCNFFRYRRGGGKPSVKLIRRECLDCCGKQKDLVKDCPSIDCAIYAFRMGKNPNYTQNRK